MATQCPPVRNEPTLEIAIMGPTGTGKTSFVNLATDSNLLVEGSLSSGTRLIQLGKELKIQGRRVILIDTPGFDDSRGNDASIFRVMTSFLAKSYGEGNKLAGVIYMHRISDVRMGGSASQNIVLAMSIYGMKAMTNMVIVTTFWDESVDEEENLREKELAASFFKTALENGAKMMRHDKTKENAHEIVTEILQNRPMPLSIQTELVDQGISLKETAAAKEIFGQFYSQLNTHEEELKSLRTSLQGLSVTEESRKQDILAKTEELEATIAGIQEEADRMAKILEEQEQIILQYKQKSKKGRFQNGIADAVNWLSSW